MPYIIWTLIVALIFLWTVPIIIKIPEFVLFSWGKDIIEVEAIWALWTITFMFLFFHWLLTLSYKIIKNFNAKNNKIAKQSQLLAQENLTLGLLTMIEGNYCQAEALLLSNINLSNNPELNYLALANIAQHQQSYDRRDIFLGKASALNAHHHSAIVIAQATMQIQSNQYEIARATLENLLMQLPEHPMGGQLLGHVYYQQEDWSSLLKLAHKKKQSSNLPFIPNLIFQPKKITLTEKNTTQSLEITALKGLLAQRPIDKEKIEAIWQCLSITTQEKSEAIYQYCQALKAVGDTEKIGPLIIHFLKQKWSNSLIQLYGELPHYSVDKSLKTIIPFLKQKGRNPHLLLCLARLYRANEQWQQASNYYIDSINLIPNHSAYLELAELMCDLDNKHNAFICYRHGLRYSVYQSGEVLHLNKLFSH